MLEYTLEKGEFFMGDITKLKTFDEIYLEKCLNHQDCLEKLQELFYASSLNIEFDYDKKEAYLITEEHKIPMKKINGIFNQGYILEVGDNLVGFYFKRISGCLDFDLELEVIVKEENNFQSFTFRQDYFGNGGPWFYYNEYVDGIARSFSTNCHSVHFTESNIPNRSVASIADNWFGPIKVKRFTKIDAKKFAFGAIGCHNGYDELGKSTYFYSPFVETEVIKKNKSEVRSLINDGSGAPVQTYEVKRKYNYTGDPDDGRFYPYFNMSEKYLNPRKPFEVYNYDDPKILDYSVNVLQRDEFQEFYQEMKQYLLNQSVGKYINKYCMNILAGIEYYQYIYQDSKTEDKNEKFVRLLDLKNTKR